MRLRPLIGNALFCGVASFGIALIAGLLSLSLQGGGDRTAAAAVTGVGLVALAIFALSVVSLVFLLAMKELRRQRRCERGGSCDPSGPWKGRRHHQEPHGQPAPHAGQPIHEGAASAGGHPPGHFPPPGGASWAPPPQTHQ